MKKKSSSPAPPPAANPSPLALEDIQGLVLRGYSYFNIRYFIFKIRDVPGGVAGARALCQALCPGSGAPLTITTAKPWSEPPPYCLNVGITNTGLTKLIGADNYTDVMNASLSLFAPFDLGAANSTTAFNVGDTDTSDPQYWWPKENCKLPSPLAPDDFDLLVCLYTRSPKIRDTYSRKLLAMIPKCADKKPALVPSFIQDADPLPPPEGSFNSGIQIHFGYADGFSQPRIQGAPWEDPGDPSDDSPFVPAWHFAVAKKTPLYNAHELLVNGSFGAFRLLYQDVEGFNNFLSKSQTPDLLAAKMCGRWQDGTPLEVSPDKPDPSLSEYDLINFNYITPTPHQKGQRLPDDLGQFCPYAAHTRRTNPRDDTAILGDTSLTAGGIVAYPYAERHRIRRFATPYGPPYTPQTSGAPRGLVGLFMGANLSEQFEFLMGQWINTGPVRDPDASPNASGVDPVFGTQADDTVSTDFAFAYCASPPPSYATVTPMTRFIVTRGGLYVFLPGINALHYLAQGQVPPSS
jgi:hypothetical protein